MKYEYRTSRDGEVSEVWMIDDGGEN